MSLESSEPDASNAGIVLKVSLGLRKCCVNMLMVSFYILLFHPNEIYLGRGSVTVAK